MSYKSMDWFSWLSKTGLEPSLVYEYGLAFDHNELEEADITYFNHEFLQSMGISIAKHRLEILKLARKQAGGKPRPLLLLITAVKKTKKCLRNYIDRWVYRSEDSSALVVMPRSNYNSRWKLKKNRRPTKLTQGRLLLTNGSSKVVAGPSLSTGTSPSVYNICNHDKVEDDDSYWGVEEIKWDTMFQDMKPT